MNKSETESERGRPLRDHDAINGPLNFTERFNLDSIDRSVRSARSVLLVINVICGYLFILQWQMMFGWQLIRPAASFTIYIENLAKLASLSPQYRPECKLSIGTFSSFENAVTEMAFDRVAAIVDTNFIRTCPSAEKLADTLKFHWCHSDGKLKTWQKEQELASFAIAIQEKKKYLEELFKSKCEKKAASLAEEINQRDTCKFEDNDSLFLKCLSTKMDHLETGLNSAFGRELQTYDSILIVRDSTIAFACQEILDRYDINEQTRNHYRVMLPI